MPDLRRVKVHAHAKLNLSLEVLNKRPDGFHNLRTLFQTISLHDEIGIELEPSAATHVEINSDIPDNLVVRAAWLMLDEVGVRANVRFALTKRIPMGGGLGGGSSDAAAVLLALPALAGRAVRLDRLMTLGAQLGSDVPFFLVGGTALGLSRGEDLYPVADSRYSMVLATPDLHSGTPEAYRSLGRDQSYAPATNAARDFLLTGDPGYWVNDFEKPVFAQHPILAELKRRMEAGGATSVRMTGSGSALFGIVSPDQKLESLRAALEPVPVLAVSAVNRLRYRAEWWRQLAPYGAEGTWPPQPR